MREEKEIRNPEQTIGKMADKFSTAFIRYVDGEGCPVTKAMLKPRERYGFGLLCAEVYCRKGKILQ